MILACGYAFLEGNSKMETQTRHKNAMVKYDANYAKWLV